MNNLFPYRASDTSSNPKRLHLTGKKKTKTITYEDGRSAIYDFVQIRVKFLGIPLWTKWVYDYEVKWAKIDEQVSEIAQTEAKQKDPYEVVPGLLWIGSKEEDLIQERKKLCRRLLLGDGTVRPRITEINKELIELRMSRYKR